MQTRVTGLYLKKNHVQLVDVFAHATKGLPGIEILGVGRRAKTIKEKLLYLSKVRGLKLPSRRYVLCVDEQVEQAEWLEFPLLLCFWTLAKVLPITRLDNCVSWGKVSVKGVVDLRLPHINENFWLGLEGQELLPIFSQKGIYHQMDYFLRAEEIFDHIPGLEFEG